MEQKKPIIKKKAPIWPQPLVEGYTIKYCFTSGGNDYFSLTDNFNSYCQRGLSAMQIYDEWQNRMTHDDQNLFIHAMENELDPDDGKIKISRISQLISYMKERVNWPVPTSELFYKMASVAVFDVNESPLFYDPIYNDTIKIKNWKENGVDAFFLSTSIRKLVPFPNIAPPVFQELMKIVDKADQIQKDYLRNLSLRES